LSLCRLYAIVDQDSARTSGWSVPALARACLEGGALLLQVRAKSLGAGEMLELSDEVAADAARFGATLIVNDRADVARLVARRIEERYHGPTRSGHARIGLHLGQEDLPPARAREVVGPSAVIGLSTHSQAQVRAALAEPISYIAVGPVFGTRTKDTGYEAVGLALVRQAARAVSVAGRRSGPEPLPVVAIGGITLDTARTVVDAGASSVAVISDLLTGGNPTERVRAYLERLS
jgi:thiamine-phosphate pyrophosphorylase